MLKSGFKMVAGTYSAISTTVHAVRHPIQAIQDAVRGFVLNAVVKVLMRLLGETAVEYAVSKISYEKTFDLKVSLPKPLRNTFLDADNCALANQVLNDALAAPLALANLTLGEVTFSPEGQELRLTGALRLRSASATPVTALPGPATTS